MWMREGEEEIEKCSKRRFLNQNDIFGTTRKNEAENKGILTNDKRSSETEGSLYNPSSQTAETNIIVKIKYTEY